MPPFFEVVNDSSRRTPVVSPSRPGVEVPAATDESSSSAPRVFPRITSREEAGAARELASAAAHDSDRVRPSSRRGGIRLSFAGAWLALGLAIATLVVVAIMAYKTGAEDEKNRLLASRTQPPPTVDQSNPSDSSTMAQPDRPSPVAASEQPVTRTNDPGIGTVPLPVFGDDPRQPGWNYLNVATLFLKDATAAAQYLTENRIACVVVPPEGVDSLKLQEDRRGNWRVIVRAGYSSLDYAKPAAEAQRSELMKRVKQLGKRWKEDRKGASSFSDCFWDKHGK